MDDSPFSFWDRKTEGRALPALWVEDGPWSESQIPPRPWIAPGYLLRGAVTVAAGIGSGGKSSLMVAWAIALALGAEYGRFLPVGPCRVLSYNVEDDSDEQKRRLSAALRQFGRTPPDLAGKVIRCGPTSIGTLIERNPQDGAVFLTAAWEMLEALIAERRPDVVMLDPLAELHTADENDNTALRHVVARLRDLAQRYACAVVLIHHTRKGGMAGDMEAIRGAGSIVAAARIALTVAPMTADEADALGISHDVRRAFFRVDTPKANYAGPAEAAWHELVPFELDNGEDIAAAVPWVPPMEGQAVKVAPETLALIGAEVARGTASGPYSPRLSQAEPRSVAGLILRHGIADPRAHKEVLAGLLRDGFTVEEWTEAGGRGRRGLRSPGGLPDVAWAPPSNRNAK